MRIHDRYARVTPYEMALPGRAFAEERFELIRDEADRRGVDIWDPGAFSMLEQSRRAIGDIRVEDDNPVLFVQYGVILFHAFHFWSAGEHLYLLGNEAAHQVTRAGLRSGPNDWDFAAPSRAGYVQLPHYLFWARPEAGGPAEALDGFFWVLTPAHRLHLMVASGMRADRPGLGVMPVPEIPGEEASRWAAANVRERGDDFASTLPGGEDLCSIETLGEVVKLAGRLFWQLERGSLRAGAPTKGGDGGSGPSERDADPATSSRAPLASTLPWRPIITAEAP
ncbi:MAG: hypothetical protein OXR82_12320 [Gammaproteobacteria bacterium]|nr:hypothetical protein [Gammaproteobacteria bacterium]MDE0259155.1 hypothetical protein [Gammaproteobacteria bacterium]